VDFSNFVPSLIDIADLGGEDKTDFAFIGRRKMVNLLEFVFLLQSKEPLLGGGELLLEFSQPSRMCEIAGTDDLYPFDTGPVIQVFRIEGFARGNGIMGMDVKVADKFHYV